MLIDQEKNNFLYNKQIDVFHIELENDRFEGVDKIEEYEAGEVSVATEEMTNFKW